MNLKKEIRELNAPAVDLIANILDKHVDAILDEVRIRFKQIKSDQSNEPAESCASLISDKTACGSDKGDCDSQPTEPVKVLSFVDLTNLAIEYGIMAGPILQGSRHAQLSESERFDAFIHTLLAQFSTRDT